MNNTMTQQQHNKNPSNILTITVPTGAQADFLPLFWKKTFPNFQNSLSGHTGCTIVGPQDMACHCVPKRIHILHD